MALQNQHLELIMDLFNDVQKKKITIEAARDIIRAELNITDRVSFPLKGYEGTDIFALCRAMLQEENSYCTSTTACMGCNTVQASNLSDLYNPLLILCTKYHWKVSPQTQGNANYHSPADWLAAYCTQKITTRCSTCNTKKVNQIAFTSAPTFLHFYVKEVKIALTVSFTFEQTRYRLCGCIYYGDFHFTSRIITAKGDIWFTDGTAYNGQCQLEGNMKNATVESLALAPDNRKCIIALYVQV